MAENASKLMTGMKAQIREVQKARAEKINQIFTSRYIIICYVEN